MIQIGNLTPDNGPVNYVSPCISFGSTLQLRLSFMSWANSERWQVDDIQVNCNNCLLSAEINNFKAIHKKGHNIVQWRTMNERNLDYFQVEKSMDGIHFSSVGELKSNQ